MMSPSASAADRVSRRAIERRQVLHTVNGEE
jgi:hypothetical protein